MKLLSIILLVLSVSANAQSKCIQPSVVGNFTPILTLQSGSTTTNYTFGILATAHNGEGIASYSYSILTGSGTLVNANSQSAYITNLTQGTTSVRLIVADSCGAKDSSYVLITVNPAPPPTKFTATATATELTSTSIRLTVTTNGGNASYWWSGAGRFSSPASYTTTVTGLQKGKAYSYSVSTTAHSGAYNGQTTSATCNITLK